MWHGTHADATWHARPRGSTTQTHASACVGLMWHGPVAGPRESTWTPRWCLHGKMVFGLASDGPTDIVGLGNSIGVVTQMPKGALPFILVDFH